MYSKGNVWIYRLWKGKGGYSIVIGSTADHWLWADLCPPKSIIEALTLRNSECDCIWKDDL